MGIRFSKWSLPLAALLLGGAAPRIMFADGAWAAFDRGARCEAASRALRVTSKRGEQASATILFARGGGRQGVLALRLGKPPRPDATVVLTVRDQPFLLVTRSRFAWSRGAAQEAAIIAALRGGGAMKVEAGAAGGGRFVDRYSLDGVAGAIDAAAACAATR
jgi:hypothetical protein